MVTITVLFLIQKCGENMFGKTNVIKSASKSPLADYLGDGSDGDIVIASGETYTVQVVANAESAILNCKSLTIESGGTLTVSDKCQGLIIKVQKDCTISGTIDMNYMSPPLVCTNEDDLASNPCITLFGGLNGGNGGKGGSSYYYQYGNSGNGVQKSGGAGGTGHVFGGGMAGGGAGYSYAGGSGTRPPVGTTWPYRTNGVGAYGSGGGSGNTAYGGRSPGGSGGTTYKSGSSSSESYTYYAGKDGNGYGGGAIYLLVGGDLTLSGTLTANGGNGAIGVSGGGYVSGNGYSSRWSNYSGSGGGGGGGLICIAHGGILTNTATLSVAAGTGGAAVSSTGSSYIKGANGSVGKTFISTFEELLPSEP